MLLDRVISTTSPHSRSSLHNAALYLPHRASLAKVSTDHFSPEIMYSHTDEPWACLPDRLCQSRPEQAVRASLNRLKDRMTG